MTTDFDSLLADMRPAVATPVAAAWDGPIPAAVTGFVTKVYTTKTPHERKLNDLQAAADLQAVCKAACDAHDPKLSLRFKRVYADLLDTDGKPVLIDGKPEEDTSKLIAVRISVSLYSPRGGGKLAEKRDAKAATATPATLQTPAPVTSSPKPSPAPKTVTKTTI